MAEKTANTSAQTAPKRRKKKSPIGKFAYGGILIVLLGFGFFYFIQYQKVNDKYQEAVLTTEERDARTIAEIAKIIDLPKDEKPTYVRKVADKDKLNETRSAREFFEKAKNDDIVLAYEKANLSVIYRPSEKRIIKSDNYQNFLAASTVISVAVVAPQEKQDELVKQLESKFGNVKIVSKNLPKVLNGASYVVDLSGSNAKTASELAGQIGFSVSSLPEGETRPQGAVFAVVMAQ